MKESDKIKKEKETSKKDTTKKVNNSKIEKNDVKKAEKTKSETNKKKPAKKVDKKKNTNLKRLLTVSLYVLIIVLVSLISFAGIYVKKANKMANVLPDYILGTDIYGARNIVLKVDTSTETKTYDADGNLIEEDSTSEENTTEENTTTKEVPVNDESVLTLDNYKKVKQTIIDRLNYMKVGYYDIKCNEADGTIYLEVPENTNTDYIAQYSVTKGSFEMSDSDSGEVYLTNKNIKDAKVQYNTTTSGTTVYLTIQFDKEGKDKLKEISTQYSSTENTETSNSENSENSEETENTENENTENENTETESTSTTTSSKKVKLTLDDQTIISSTFDEPITDGIIQLSLGTSSETEQINTYLQQASNIAVFLNSEALPITYTIDTNRFVYSDVTTKTLETIIIVAVVVFIIMLAYMIIKYKKLGALGAITTIGFMAILLIVIRYANVDITGTGLVSIGLTALFEYLAFMQIFKVNNSDLDKETKQKEIKHTIIRQIETMIPLIIITIVFAVAKWEPLYSMGMILFWGVLIALLYNCITIKIMLPKERE